MTCITCRTAKRGRSLGVILIGAQQTASEVERRTLAKPGMMFIAQPDIPVPLAVDFPFPAWATRPSETRIRRPGWLNTARGVDRIPDDLNHGPFGEKNFNIPNGHWLAI